MPKLQDTATLDDYLREFAQYGVQVEFLYLDGQDEQYELLFERIMRLLAQPSEYNRSLPEPFRKTAMRYQAGDVETREQLEDRDTRHFLLCEVYDYVMLTGGLAKRRAQRVSR